MADDREVRGSDQLYTAQDVDLIMVWAGLVPDFKVARERRVETELKLAERARTMPTTSNRLTLPEGALAELMKRAYDAGVEMGREGGGPTVEQLLRDYLDEVMPPAVLSDGYPGGFPSDRLVEGYLGADAASS